MSSNDNSKRKIPPEAFVVLLLLPLVVFGGCWSNAQSSVDHGQYDCVVHKIGLSGRHYVTYEGEATPVGGGHRFYFTAVEPEAVRAIQELPPGQVVRLKYEEMGAVWYPRGESRFLVTKATVVPEVSMKGVGK